MAITLVNPQGLPEVPLYRHVAVGTGSKHVFVAGQVAWDAEGQTVGEGDLAAQVAQAYQNVATALAGVGGSLEDLARLTVYVVDMTPDKLPLVVEGLTRAAATLGATPLTPATLVGVTALDVPEHLVEIEANAVMD